MSIRSRPRRKQERADRPAYLDKFVKDAHRLSRSGMRGWTRRARRARKRRRSPRAWRTRSATSSRRKDARWVDRYVVNDEIRLRHPTRKAKKRPRIDIQIVYVKGRPRPRFHFEAKRFGPNNHVGDYLGKEGLGCFLTGDYARDSEDAGMLGYVQHESCDGWAQKIEQSLLKDPAKYCVVSGTSWKRTASSKNSPTLTAPGTTDRRSGGPSTSITPSSFFAGLPQHERPPVLPGMLGEPPDVGVDLGEEFPEVRSGCVEVIDQRVGAHRLLLLGVAVHEGEPTARLSFSLT